MICQLFHILGEPVGGEVYRFPVYFAEIGRAHV